MVEDPPFETATHMVSHCLREIESALRDVLKPVALHLNLARGTAGDDPQPRQKKKQKGTPKLSFEEEIRLILDALHIAETDSIAQLWLRIAVQTGEFGLRHYAHRNNLAAARPLTEAFWQYWREMNQVFERVLDAFEANYLATHALIDTKLLSGTMPMDEKVAFLTLSVPHNLVSLGYFFEKIGERHETAWLLPLRNKGFFQIPPPPEYDEGKKVTTFPQWSASRYLVQVASLEPRLVMDILLHIPVTENVLVHEDCVEAACQM